MFPIKVTSLADSPKNLAGNFYAQVDDKVYLADSSYGEMDSLVETLNPGEVKSGLVPFVVPVNSVISSIFLGPQESSSKRDALLSVNVRVSAIWSGLPVVTGNSGEAPRITPPKRQPLTTLKTQDIFVGTGAKVLSTSFVTVHYTLMGWSNGSIIESSWSIGQPATFPLTGVIAGWQEGLPGAQVGGRRLLVVPPDKGYGANGSGPVGPNETLIFVIDIIAVS